MASFNFILHSARTAPFDSLRRGRSGVPTVVLAAILATTAGASAVAGPDAADGTGVELRDDAGAAARAPNPQALLLNVARQTVLPPQQRREAIRSLLDYGDPAIVDRLVEALAPGEDPVFQRLIAQTLTERPEPPPESFAAPLLGLLLEADGPLLDELADAVGRCRVPSVTRRLTDLAADSEAPVRERCAAIRPLAFHRTREVAELLVALLGPDEPEVVARVAAGALTVFTGIEEFGQDRTKWRQWWSRSNDLPTERWYAALADNLAKRVGALERRNDHADGQLLKVYRQLYRATAQDQREALLVALLVDPSSSIRQLAIDLMGQRLSDQQRFGPELRAALLPALGDELASIRRGSARLLRDLGDDRGADAMARRLVGGQEQDRGVLKVYLLMMADKLYARSVDSAMALLADPDLRNEAAGVLVRAAEQGVLGDRQRADLKLRLRRQIQADAPPEPKVIELLGYVGEAEDWRRIERWIDSDQDKAKEAAASAWARSDRSLAVLAERADDPLIQPIVIAAAARRGREAKTLLLLLGRRPEQDQARQAWQRALVAMAGRVPAVAVLEAQAALAADETASGLRRQMLSEAIGKAPPQDGNPSAGNGNGNGNGRKGPALPVLNPDVAPQVMVDLLLARAEIRLADGEATTALADLALITARKWALEPVKRQRHEELSMRARLLAGDADGAFQLAGDVLQRARDADDDAFQNAVVVIATTFLDAVDGHVKANQAEQAEAILDELEELAGRWLPQRFADRVKQLRAQVEQLASPEGVTTPKPPAAPRTPIVPKRPGAPRTKPATTPKAPTAPNRPRPPAQR